MNKIVNKRLQESFNTAHIKYKYELLRAATLTAEEAGFLLNDTKSHIYTEREYVSFFKQLKYAGASIRFSIGENNIMEFDELVVVDMSSCEVRDINQARKIWNE